MSSPLVSTRLLFASLMTFELYLPDGDRLFFLRLCLGCRLSSLLREEMFLYE